MQNGSLSTIEITFTCETDHTIYAPHMHMQERGKGRDEDMLHV